MFNVVLGACFLWKYVFGIHGSTLPQGLFQNADLLKIGRARWICYRRWRIRRRSRLMESWLFHFFDSNKGVKNIFYA